MYGNDEEIVRFSPVLRLYCTSGILFLHTFDVFCIGIEKCFVVFFKGNAIFVDRFNPKRAKEALIRSAETVRDKKLSVLVFPEGTRNHEGGMLEFKKGAFNIAVQVLKFFAFFSIYFYLVNVCAIRSIFLF